MKNDQKLQNSGLWNGISIFTYFTYFLDKNQNFLTFHLNGRVFENLSGRVFENLNGGVFENLNGVFLRI